MSDAPSPQPPRAATPSDDPTRRIPGLAGLADMDDEARVAALAAALRDLRRELDDATR